MRVALSSSPTMQIEAMHQNSGDSITPEHELYWEREQQEREAMQQQREQELERMETRWVGGKLEDEDEDEDEVLVSQEFGPGSMGITFEFMEKKGLNVVTDVQGKAAEVPGKIRPGDNIVKVNGESLSTRAPRFQKNNFPRVIFPFAKGFL